MFNIKKSGIADDEYTVVTFPLILYLMKLLILNVMLDLIHITFSGGSSQYSGLNDHSTPDGLPSIKLSSDDNSYQRIYTESFDYGTFTIRYEGTNST